MDRCIQKRHCEIADSYIMLLFFPRINSRMWPENRSRLEGTFVDPGKRERDLWKRINVKYTVALSLWIRCDYLRMPQERIQERNN